MVRKIRLTVFGALALFLTGFIFFNSFQSGEVSNAASGWVADFLRPLLNPNGWLEDEMYHKLVRKLAHFTEFGALGFCLGFVANDLLLPRKWLCAIGTAVAIACADETIQAFTGRTNSLKDVCIDSAGALCGIGLTALVLVCVRKIKKPS